MGSEADPRWVDLMIESSAIQTLTRFWTTSSRLSSCGVINFPHPESMFASLLEEVVAEFTDTRQASTSDSSSSSLVPSSTKAALVDFVFDHALSVDLELSSRFAAP